MAPRDAAASNFDDVMMRRFLRVQKRAFDALDPKMVTGLMGDSPFTTPETSPFFLPVDAMASSVSENGGTFTSFGHYDYLGLAHHPAVIGAAVDALHRFGAGAGASRLVGGERSIHRAFENDLAAFLGVGGALTLVSGYLTNLTLIPHLLMAQDLLIVDDLAHNSSFSAARGGRYAHRTFEHNDCDALDRLLERERGNYRNVLVVVEGLYSMDGDIPDLPRLLEIKERHNAWLMLDEAHSYGVLGPTGRGVTEHFGIDPRRVDISVGTLSKSFCASGGFVAASSEVIEWLRYTLPGFVFSVGLAPATVAIVHAALRILRSEPDRVARLRRNAAHFLRRAREAGLDTGPAIGEAIVPILFRTSEQAVIASETLRAHGVFAPPVFQVGVPVDKPRVRFFLSAEHEFAQIDAVIGLLAGLQG